MICVGQTSKLSGATEKSCTAAMEAVGCICPQRTAEERCVMREVALFVALPHADESLFHIQRRDHSQVMDAQRLEYVAMHVITQYQARNSLNGHASPIHRDLRRGLA